MKPVAFRTLLKWVLKEYHDYRQVFFVPAVKIDQCMTTFFGKKLEVPIGPAAGPHTQLAQNLISAYAAGGRYFELKTVQVIEGNEIQISKPSIFVRDEAYNVEWSTELTLQEALNEYIKAWFIIKLIAKEFDLGDPDAFIFNMCVGYELEGIRSRKIDDFIEGLKDASALPVWEECMEETLKMLGEFEIVDEQYIRSISPKICDSVTLCTLNGISAEQMERIAVYLLKEKKLHTLVKLNPTLLGYDTVRMILDSTGYKFMQFSPEQFENDMKYGEAIGLISRIKDQAELLGMHFGVKLTNAFPVQIEGRVLEGDFVLMSGKALYPVAIRVAKMIGEAFDGKLPISYSGGIDRMNVSDVFDTGIYPITVTTVLLKQGGYSNLTRMFQEIRWKKAPNMNQINIEALGALAKDVISDSRYHMMSSLHKKMNFAETVALDCHLCNNCVDICPNRANIPMDNGNVRQSLHVDALCNECGNCSCHCPVGFSPYQEKFTYFSDQERFYESNNDGIFIDKKKYKVRFRGELFEMEGDLKNIVGFPKELTEMLYSFFEGINKVR